MLRSRVEKWIAALMLCVLSPSARADTGEQTVNFDYTIDVPAETRNSLSLTDKERDSLTSQVDRAVVPPAPESVELNSTPAASVPLPVALAPGLIGLAVVGIVKKFGRRIIA